MSYQTVKNFRQRLKQRCVYVLGDKCQCCGYDKCITALEFHHLDPTEKELTFGTNTNRSWETVRAELPKCILVCANCHREIHSGLIDNNTLISSFDENRAKEIDNLINQLKQHKLHYCVDCGDIIDAKATRCVKCSNLNRQIVKRPDRDELKKMIRSIPFTKIGQLYNVSDNTIRKWCDSYSLPRSSKEIKSYTIEEWNKI